MKHNGSFGSHTAEDLKIGGKVRELRHKKRYTLEDLAKKTGVDKSVLSQIEAGNVIPPVATLLRLSKAFGVGMAHFFEDQAVVEKISVTRKGDRIRLERRPHHQKGEVDYIYESLEMRKPDKHMEPLFVEFRPMETSDMVFVSHEGEEFIFVLEGILEFRSDDRTEVLEAGDAIYFESDINHSFRALGEKPATAIGVIWAKT